MRTPRKNTDHDNDHGHNIKHWETNANHNNKRWSEKL